MTNLPSFINDIAQGGHFKKLFEGSLDLAEHCHQEKIDQI